MFVRRGGAGALSSVQGDGGAASEEDSLLRQEQVPPEDDRPPPEQHRPSAREEKAEHDLPDPARTHAGRIVASDEKSAAPDHDAAQERCVVVRSSERYGPMAFSPPDRTKTHVTPRTRTSGPVVHRRDRKVWDAEEMRVGRRSFGTRTSSCPRRDEEFCHAADEDVRPRGVPQRSEGLGRRGDEGTKEVVCVYYLCFNCSYTDDVQLKQKRVENHHLPPPHSLPRHLSLSSAVVDKIYQLSTSSCSSPPQDPSHRKITDPPPPVKRLKPTISRAVSVDPGVMGLRRARFERQGVDNICASDSINSPNPGVFRRKLHPGEVALVDEAAAEHAAAHAAAHVLSEQDADTEVRLKDQKIFKPKGTVVYNVVRSFVPRGSGRSIYWISKNSVYW